MLYPQVIILSHNSKLRKVYQSLLHDVECEVHSAKNVADMLVTMVLNDVHVVVLDNSLPSFDILTLLEILRSKPQWKNVKLVALGCSEIAHLMPKNTVHVPLIDSDKTKQSFVSSVSASCDTV
jgi:CheY-like chemotaxis protein